MACFGLTRHASDLVDAGLAIGTLGAADREGKPFTESGNVGQTFSRMWNWIALEAGSRPTRPMAALDRRSVESKAGGGRGFGGTPREAGEMELAEVNRGTEADRSWFFSVF